MTTPSEEPSYTTPATDRKRILRHLLVVLIFVVIGYLVAVTVTLLTAHQEPVSEIDRVGGTRLTLDAQTLDGAPPSHDTLADAQQIIAARVSGLGIKDAEVVVDGDKLAVTVPRDDADQLTDLGKTDRLYIRPVLQEVSAQTGADQPTTSGSLAARIAAQKEARQSTDPHVQVTALTLQATRCGKDDPLAGNDDPTLPLITCSTDGTTAYLLGPSIIGGDQVKDASSGLDQQSGSNVVDLQFTKAATTTWADYTAAHIGTAIAFTLDTRVLSAPTIREAIPGGRTQISGRFTQADATELAVALSHQPLPVAFKTTGSEPVAPKPEKSVFASPEFGLIGIGLVLMVGLIGGLLFLTMRGPKSSAG